VRRLLDRWRRFRALARRRDLEIGLDAEIRFHVDQQIAKNIRAGLPPDEAQRQALVAFGGIDRTKESTRDQLRFVAVENLVRDCRHGARGLLLAPGFLALGARPGELRRMFVTQALGLVAIGVVTGLAAAAGLARFIESQLFGVTALDPATHLTIAGFLVIAAGLASYVSARRASRLDPVEVLKRA
jgi:preprotein translocase subunit Sec61beta